MKMDMVLTPKAVSLKEVTVKPDPLRQKDDTLTHNLASFLGKGDGVKPEPETDGGEDTTLADDVTTGGDDSGESSGEVTPVKPE